MKDELKRSQTDDNCIIPYTEGIATWIEKKDIIWSMTGFIV